MTIYLQLKQGILKIYYLGFYTVIYWVKYKYIKMEKIVEILFGGSVVLLQELGKLIGMTYEEVNILVFYVALPIVLLGMIVTIIVQNRRIRKLKRAVMIQ